MANVVVIYHSGYGHTAKQAEAVVTLWTLDWHLETARLLGVRVAEFANK